MAGFMTWATAKERAVVLKIMRYAYRTIRARKRWVQGTFRKDTDVGVAYCAIGSVQKAFLDLRVNTVVQQTIIDLLDAQAEKLKIVDADGDRLESIVDLNDQDDADKAHREVLAVFRWLIKQLQPKKKRTVVVAPPLAPSGESVGGMDVPPAILDTALSASGTSPGPTKEPALA